MIRGSIGNDSIAVSTLLAEATVCLTIAGVENPRLDARRLLAHVLEVAPQSLATGRGLFLSCVEKQTTFTALVTRRAQREPVSRILGWRGFWTLDCRINAETFDPRPETETVVETILNYVVNRQTPYSLLDLGSGSGSLLLALLSELPNATGIGVDIAAGAVEVARVNAALAGLATRARFQVGDWGEGLEEVFDVIMANPPYIAESDISSLSPEVVQFDPRCALVGGRDGLAAYRAMAPSLIRLLSPRGLVALEIGKGQASAVKEIMTGSGLAFLDCRPDLSGVTRCVLFQRKVTGHEKSAWQSFRS
ncbi:Protein-N(5)-glutamine methyltransferase PrmC, methylates polypeptide chain release factors RF1 and RF2 [invertebrate metagenome]|uniref:Protein-N(5)-glutamine methyltransferase PrmC, methylates polypeptide chain release factors RF1 and RF2 n=1 Tax=invertebrate metagenome TaxID=1711999 RepID=A0A484HB09_9ZZZZ